MAAINYLGACSLGKVLTWDSKKVAELTAIPMPTQDAGGTQAVDAMGMIGYINLTGRWTGSFSEIQSYISKLKSVADGYQVSSQPLKSPFVNSVNSAGYFKIGSIGTVSATDFNALVDTSATFLSDGVSYTGDLVKNLETGEVASIYSVTNTKIELTSPYTGSTLDLFKVVGQAYAVTATINVKILSIVIKWSPPGLGYCDYELNLIQVA